MTTAMQVPIIPARKVGHIPKGWSCLDVFLVY